MPMPTYDPGNPPMLGFFMVGAYQEILGSMHNLFGNTEALDLYLYHDGSLEARVSDKGNTIADALEYVQLNPDELTTLFSEQLEQTDIGENLRVQFLKEFKSRFHRYTYLEDQ